MSILLTKFETKINRLEKQDCKYFLFIEIFQRKKIIRSSQYSLNHSRHFESLDSDTHGLDDLMPFKRLCKLIKYYSCEETFRHKILF